MYKDTYWFALCTRLVLQDVLYFCVCSSVHNCNVSPRCSVPRSDVPRRAFHGCIGKYTKLFDAIKDFGVSFFVLCPTFFRLAWRVFFKRSRLAFRKWRFGRAKLPLSWCECGRLAWPNCHFGKTMRFCTLLEWFSDIRRTVVKSETWANYLLIISSAIGLVTDIGTPTERKSYMFPFVFTQKND